MKTPEQLSPNQTPTYFRAERLATAEVEQSTDIATNVIDAFYIQSKIDSATDTIYTVATLDGAVRPVINRVEDNELPDIQDQIHAVDVSQRESYRGVRAEQLSFMSVKQIGYGARVQGFNDPIELHGNLNATLSTSYQEATAQTAHTPGVLTVGRLDLLRAYRVGATQAFQKSKNGAEAYMIPLLLPAGPASSITRGGDMVMAYTMNSGGDVFAQADNSYLMLSMAYDLLSQLQEDMHVDGVEGTLTSIRIPAPSRAQLEAELVLDGYQIEGDEAVRTSTAASADRKGLLGRLRGITANWSAERIQLPPEATHKDYLELIDTVLSEIVTAQDAEMTRALEDNVQWRMNAVARRSASTNPTTIGRLAVPPSTITPRVQQTTKKPSAYDSSPVSTNDFLKRSVTPPKQEMDLSNDFITPTQIGQRAIVAINLENYSATNDFGPSNNILPPRQPANDEVSNSENMQTDNSRSNSRIEESHSGSTGDFNLKPSEDPGSNTHSTGDFK